MAHSTRLYIHEEIMLLALRDEKGTIESGTQYQYSIGGAILAELLLENRLKIEQKKKTKYAIAQGLSHVGDDLMDECLKKVRDAKKPLPLQTWVAKFASISKLKHRVAHNLSRKGILRVEEDKILGIFSRKVYPEFNPEPENELRNRLHDAIFSDSTDVDPRTVVLLSLAQQGGLLKVAFDKKELKARKDRIDAVINGDVAGKATKDAVQAMQAAVAVATMIPVITTTAVH